MKIVCPHCGHEHELEHFMGVKILSCQVCQRKFPVELDENGEVPGKSKNAQPRSQAGKAMGMSQNPVCPECGYLMEKENVVCISCGYDIRSG